MVQVAERTIRKVVHLAQTTRQSEAFCLGHQRTLAPSSGMRPARARGHLFINDRAVRIRWALRGPRWSVRRADPDTQAAGGNGLGLTFTAWRVWRA